MSSPVSKITDHAARLKADILGQFHGDPVALAICDVVGDELQRLENLLYDVAVKSRLGSDAEGAILDRLGKIVRALRLSLDDERYLKLIKVAIASSDSDGGVDDVLWIINQLTDENVRYYQKKPRAGRLEYTSTDPVTGEFQDEAVRLIEKAAPAGVNVEICEGIPDLVRQYDTGPGYGTGAYGRRVDGHDMDDLTDLLTDGDAEAAGWAAWTALNSPTLSKETGSPDPVEGSQWGKIAYNGTSLPLVAQTVLTIGKRYWLTGSSIGDGASGNLWIADGAAVVYTGGTSSAWKDINEVFIATGTALQVIANVSAAGWAGFDNLRLYEIVTP